MKELKSILHVDDDCDILDIAKMSLELVGGYEVHQSNSAKDAHEKLAGFTPDLLLLDVMMPETDGPTLLEQLRAIERFRELPVVFMTAKSETDLNERLSGKRVLGVVIKPFDPMSLPSQLEELWATSSGDTEAA